MFDRVRRTYDLALIAALLPWLPGADRFAEPVPPALLFEAVFLRLALGGALAAFTLGTLRPEWRGRALGVAGACVASAGFEALMGVRIVDPQEIEWILGGQDARWYYLDFEFFRREPWTWPPGRITRLLYPVGTSVGNTDSLPLLSLPLKLVSGWLPDEFQFLGFWMLACVALQGVFAALLVRAAGGSWLYQSLALFFFLVTPSAVPSVERVGLHTARWLTMASLWLYVRPANRLGRDLAAWAVVIAVAGLTHPYSCVMVVPLALAYYVRRWALDREVSLPGASICLAALALLLGTCWLLGGYFTVSSLQSLNGTLGSWSMNILSPINPMGHRSLLPSLPLATGGQYEGFHYLGLGVLLLIPFRGVAAALAAAVAGGNREVASSVDRRPLPHHSGAQPEGDVRESRPVRSTLCPLRSVWALSLEWATVSPRRLDADVRRAEHCRATRVVAARGGRGGTGALRAMARRRPRVRADPRAPRQRGSIPLEPCPPARGSGLPRGLGQPGALRSHE